MLLDIHLIEVTSIIHLGRNDLCQFGNGTLDSGRCFLVAVVSCITTTPTREKNRCSRIQLRHLLFQTLDILIFHRPPTTFAESLIRFGGLLGTNDDSILCETVEVLVEHLLQALSAAHQHHEHKDAPEHAESREERTRLITRQRVDDLSV